MEYEKAGIVKMLSSLPFSESSGAARTKGRAAAFLFLDLMRQKYKRSINKNVKILLLRVWKGKSRKGKIWLKNGRDNVGSSSGNFDEKSSTT